MIRMSEEVSRTICRYNYKRLTSLRIKFRVSENRPAGIGARRPRRKLAVISNSARLIEGHIKAKETSV